jgi:hypothetical protein
VQNIVQKRDSKNYRKYHQERNLEKFQHIAIVMEPLGVAEYHSRNGTSKICRMLA